MFNFIKNISPIELGAIVLVLVVIFGATVVTKLGRAGGETFKEIKRIKRTFTEAVEDDNDKLNTNKKELSK